MNPCRTCHAVGALPNEEWLAWTAEHNRLVDQVAAAEHTAGYGDLPQRPHPEPMPVQNARLHLEVHGLTVPAVPEFRLCPDCGGARFTPERAA